jgi:hypothetical protein
MPLRHALFVVGTTRQGGRNFRVESMRSIAIFWLLLASPAFADPLPVTKPLGPGGSCPHGYFSSGSFCVPSQGAQDAIPQPTGATCPHGWTSSGSYCLRSGR